MYDLGLFFVVFTCKHNCLQINRNAVLRPANLCASKCKHNKLVNKNKQPQAIKTLFVAYGGSSNNETWYTESSSKQKLQVSKYVTTNSLGQKKLGNGVCVYQLLEVGPLTMKLSTLIYHGKS